MKKLPALFQDLHHVCIVVRDIEASTSYYESIGVGPWQQMTSFEAFREELQVPDIEAFMQLKYRYALLNNIQIQLCEPPDGNTLQRRFLEQHGEGVFHLGFTVADCNTAEELGEAVGLEVLMRGRKPDRSGFTYFHTAEGGAGVTLEIRAASK